MWVVGKWPGGADHEARLGAIKLSFKASTQSELRAQGGRQLLAELSQREVEAVRRKAAARRSAEARISGLSRRAACGRPEPVAVQPGSSHRVRRAGRSRTAYGGRPSRLSSARSSPSRMSALGRSGWLQGASLQAAICQGHRCDALCRDAGALAWTELEAQEIVRAFASTSVVSIARSWCILRPCGARSF